MGDQVFLTCCSLTSYCLRLEVYCGKKAHLRGPQTIDDKSGPAEVLRNMSKVIPSGRSAYHLVVFDRFYSSVALALELLANKIYVVGTVQTRRIGYPSSLKDRRKKRPADVPRGSYTIARSRSVPVMLACCWWDSKPVHFLATSASTQELTTVRNSYVEGESVGIPCPKVVKDYHRHMDGVDIHDQLRLQRYSIQMAFTFKKYYKTLFLGLLDIAITNAYVIHRTAKHRAGKRGLSHAEFLTMLHAQLLGVEPQDMQDNAELASNPVPTSVSRQRSGLSYHIPTPIKEHSSTSGRAMARACKVCSVTSTGKRRGKNTKWFCEPFTQAYGGPVYLCQLVREGSTKSCFAIWHETWDNGRLLKEPTDKRIQFRRPNGP